MTRAEAATTTPATSDFGDIWALPGRWNNPLDATSAHVPGAAVPRAQPRRSVSYAMWAKRTSVDSNAEHHVDAVPGRAALRRRARRKPRAGPVRQAPDPEADRADVG